jgi:rhodanese-related sulfurtransferase
MSRVDAALAAGAALLGALAGVVALTGNRAGVFDRPLPALIQGHQLTALELAGWLRDRKPNLTILDVRPDSAAFADFHLPRALHISFDRLREVAPGPGVVVVYADGSDLAARAWLVLRALGHDSVRVMPDGVGSWLADILNPRLPSDATPGARAAFAAQAELSRYFGGLPRVMTPGEAAGADTGTAAWLRTTARRGCAF